MARRGKEQAPQGGIGEWLNTLAKPQDVTPPPVSTFRATLGVCGLSISEAAIYLELSDVEVERLCTHSSEVDDRVWRKLVALYLDILETAELAEDMFVNDSMPKTAFDAFEIGQGVLPHGAAAAAGAMVVLSEFAYQLVSRDAEDAVFH